MPNGKGPEGAAIRGTGADWPAGAAICPTWGRSNYAGISGAFPGVAGGAPPLAASPWE